ncbi:MAG: hypothetical protein DI630_14115 [Gordonia sp. (in: high G+C Gram-positive bacteria)]|nr:MAG: hypothetical protein DI630_14115 [Gordonia sp. (in: high G+C Gram-positive bacteria)]
MQTALADQLQRGRHQRLLAVSVSSLRTDLACTHVLHSALSNTKPSELNRTGCTFTTTQGLNLLTSTHTLTRALGKVAAGRTDEIVRRVD